MSWPTLSTPIRVERWTHVGVRCFGRHVSRTRLSILPSRSGPQVLSIRLELVNNRARLPTGDPFRRMFCQCVP